ncbi:hypothetical protein [Brevibacterium sediminis]
MAESRKYRKKPAEIEAMRLAGSPGRTHAVTSWMESNLYPFLVGNALEPESLRYPNQFESDSTRPDKGIYIDPATGSLMIRTMEGDMRASLGDYIIKGVQGEFYPCKPDIFHATYEEVED